MKEFKAVQMVLIERSKEMKRPSICCKSLAHSFKSMLFSIIGEVGRLVEVSICESDTELSGSDGSMMTTGDTVGLVLVGTELVFSSEATLGFEKSVV